MSSLSRSPRRGALGGVVALLLALLAGPVSAQGVGTISGQITAIDLDLPVPGANVRLQGTTLGAATDAEGVFSFSAPAGDYTVVITALGYRTVSRPLTVRNGANTDLNVELAEDALLLDQVVVTGYGSRERRNLATSISTIDGAEIEDIPVATVDGALQGRSAGVTVLRSSGTPGGGISVRIRGATSISGSNEPLYVIDGVPVATGSYSALGVGNQGTNALASINTQDIESIEILKDAAATAIYGTRAANGVVLITTKRGRNGTTQVSLETSIGSVDIPNDYAVLTGSEYISIRNEGVFNQFGLEDFFGDPADFADQNSNFFDEIRRTGSIQTYRLSLNGGDERTRFLVSGSYGDEQGALISSGFQRYNGRVNVDHTPNDRTIIQANVSYNRGEIDRIENDNNIYGVLTNALISPPTVPTRDSLGNLTPGSQFAFDNPVAATEIFQESIETKFLGNVSGSYEFVDGLRASVRAGLDRFDFKDDQYSPSYTRQGAPSGGAFSSVGINQRYILEGTLNYRRLFNEVHDASFIIGTSAEDNQYEQTFSSSSDFATDALIRVSNGATTTGGSNGTDNSLLSFFGNVDYSYDSRYLLAFNGRVDGSSRFGADNRFAFFPGVALGWNVHEEGFMQGADFLDLLKLRASAGRTGQQEIGNFASLGLFGLGASYGPLPAATPTQLANPGLKWETTTQISGGLDFGILNGRVSGVIDAYYKGTDDLLLNRPLPSQVGFTSITSNVGSIENRGIEFQLTTQNVRTRNFRWETTVNLSRNRNEITALFDDEPFSTGFGSRVDVGQPLGVFYGHQANGFFLNESEVCLDATGVTCLANGTAYQKDGTSVGDIRFRDIGRYVTNAETGEQEFEATPDGIVNDADETFIGDPNPDLFGGVSNSITFMGVELSAFVQFSLGNDVFNAVRQFNEDVGVGNTRLSFGVGRAVLDRIQLDADGNVINPDATQPRATFSDPNDNDRDSDFYVEDGSYVRLKTVTLGYNVPARYLGMVGARSLRIYGLAENLVTFTDYSGLDPEVSTFDGSNTSFGTDFFTYPQTRKFVVGVQLGL
jgi:TonB-dependent starch-binding outer membrane protein SusC